jgi:GTP-binding protein
VTPTNVNDETRDGLDVVRTQQPTDSNLRDRQYKIIADLSERGDMFVAARGGAGGKGNHFFLSNENRQPRVSEQGGEGEQGVYLLEMKTIAHIGLVGFPNAGKSTLLRGISRARPKVAAYPFTTLQPELGIVSFSDEVQLVVADLPGLIEGAHTNRGLGHSFLRHLERCVCLVYVLDLSQSDAVEQFQVLRNELNLFKPGLAHRPHAIVGNKIDVPGAEHQLIRLRAYIREQTPEEELPLPVIPISAKFGTNLLEYLKHIRGLFDLYNKPEVDEQGFQW